MQTDKNYLMIGSFVLLVAVGIGLFSVWLAGPRDRLNYETYRVRFAESVSGLNEGSPVKFRGVNVGKVQSIVIDPVDTRLIRVDIDILRTTPIKTDTTASLKMQGVTGAVFVELQGGSPGLPNLKDKKRQDEDKDYVAEIPAKGSSINALLDRVPQILEKISTVADQFNKLFSDQNINSVSNSVAEWEKISTALSAQSESFIRISQKLDTLVTRTNDTAGGQYQQLYQLLLEMRKTSREVSDLARSLKEDPSRVIIPTKEKGVPAP